MGLLVVCIKYGTTGTTVTFVASMGLLLVCIKHGTTVTFVSSMVLLLVCVKYGTTVQTFVSSMGLPGLLLHVYQVWDYC